MNQISGPADADAQQPIAMTKVTTAPSPPRMDHRRHRYDTAKYSPRGWAAIVHSFLPLLMWSGGPEWLSLMVGSGAGTAG